MHEGSRNALRVALIAKHSRRPGFHSTLQCDDIKVVCDREPGESVRYDLEGADVALVDLDTDAPRAWIEDLLDISPVPILLNQGGVGLSESWKRSLIAKLRALGPLPRAPTGDEAVDSRPGLRLVNGHSVLHQPASLVVVLCGSMGGPKAMARFLTVLASDLPISLLVAQHISQPFDLLLSRHLDRCGPWRVATLVQPTQLEPGQVWVVPAQNRIVIEPSGRVQLSDQAWEAAQKPDINAVLSAVAEAFGPASGAIVFSGLGGAGALGCESVIRRGGFVWTQSSESCVVPHLPEAARRSGKVAFSGTPEQLARELAYACEPRTASLN
jgi:chemosensory pili system protein ChpB (putative protein-glutamate methylesterase)